MRSLLLLAASFRKNTLLYQKRQSPPEKRKRKASKPERYAILGESKDGHGKISFTRKYGGKE
jgi:hypothetical protein